MPKTWAAVVKFWNVTTEVIVIIVYFTNTNQISFRPLKQYFQGSAVKSSHAASMAAKRSHLYVAGDYILSISMLRIITKWG